MLDAMSNKDYSYAASLGFERSSYAELVSELQARIDKGSEFLKAQVSLTKFRFAGQFNRILFNSGFFAPNDAVERRYRQFSAATLHADMLDKPALDGRGFARCSNRLLQRNRFLPIDPAPSRRNLHLISERLFRTAHAVSDSPMAGHRYVRSIV